jgi:hypothetical protein
MVCVVIYATTHCKERQPIIDAVGENLPKLDLKAEVGLEYESKDQMSVSFCQLVRTKGKSNGMRCLCWSFTGYAAILIYTGKRSQA